LLEGRSTPSRGLDIAAEYIAAQFRRAGLEPVGDDGYFQSARYLSVEYDFDGFDLKLENGSDTVVIPKEQATLQLCAGLDLAHTPVFKLGALPDSPQPAQETVTGKAVLIERPASRGTNAAQQRQAYRAALKSLRAMTPAVIIAVSRRELSDQSETALVDPDTRNTPPLIVVHGPAAQKFSDALKAGSTGATISIHVKAPIERPVKLRNVIGLLRGSDTVLKDSYIVVTAHYDHLGIRKDGEGDRIYNGANDDGSGTVSVIELASALATLKQHPKRSIVFLAFFGEEEGGYGSRYYVRHPIFPLAKTIADINLEQIGRTDSSEGPQIANATFTGFDYSDLPLTFQRAGARTGLKVYQHDKNSDPYFARSDNLSFAEVGVPAHTLAVAFVYPDYHEVGDEWEKIDYENMAQVDRMVALGLVMLADGAEAPKWNESNAKTERYVKAWKANHRSETGSE
jgi:hypothetical protein